MRQMVPRVVRMNAYCISKGAHRRFPIENPGKSRKIADLGSGEVWGIFLLFFKKSGQKATYNYSASFWTFGFRVGKTRKPSIFVVPGPSGRDHGPQNQLLRVFQEILKFIL